jgi:hypothetical protein
MPARFRRRQGWRRGRRRMTPLDGSARAAGAANCRFAARQVWRVAPAVGAGQHPPGRTAVVSRPRQGSAASLDPRDARRDPQSRATVYRTAGLVYTRRSPPAYRTAGLAHTGRSPGPAFGLPMARDGTCVCGVTAPGRRQQGRARGHVRLRGPQARAGVVTSLPPRRHGGPRTPLRRRPGYLSPGDLRVRGRDTRPICGYLPRVPSPGYLPGPAGTGPRPWQRT